MNRRLADPRRARLAKRAGLAVGVLAGVALIAGLLAAREPQAVPGPGKELALPADGARIVLGANDRRTLAMPDGKQRRVSSILNVRRSMDYGDFVWNEQSVPAGAIWVRIDLKHQILSVFRGGHEIGTGVILYGADNMPTPTGRFPILAKLKDHYSRTYDNAPMPYTLRLTPDGVAVHGSNVRYGAATHGCVGIPTTFAKKVFAAVSVGTPVYIVGA